MAQVIAEALVGRRGWDGVEIRSAGVSAAWGGGASEGARVADEHALAERDRGRTGGSSAAQVWTE